jgi:hypothetical protein
MAGAGLGSANLLCAGGEVVDTGIRRHDGKKE